MTQRCRQPVIAYFDLDLTVLGVNSASLWIRRELRDGYLTRWQALQGAVWIGMYQLGVAAMDDAVRKAIASMAGSEEGEVRARTEAFWREEVVHAIRPGAREALSRHRESGHRLAILTSSSNYLSDMACAELRFDDVLCNRFTTADGRFTGAAAEPLCFGVGKVAHARTLALQHGVDLADCAFYTDSFSDLPLLELVGKPVAVNADPRLSREARKRGWEVVDWGTAERVAL